MSQNHDYWVPAAVRNHVIKRDGGICKGCGRHVSGDNATLDHIKPLYKNGPKLQLSNLRLLCRSCNSRRGAIQQNKELRKSYGGKK